MPVWGITPGGGSEHGDGARGVVRVPAWLSALLGRVFERESMTDHTGEHERTRVMTREMTWVTQTARALSQDIFPIRNMSVGTRVVSIACVTVGLSRGGIYLVTSRSSAP